VSHYLQAHTPAHRPSIHDLCASFQEAIVEVLVKKTLKAAQEHQLTQIVVGGGVAANRRLRAVFKKDRKGNLLDKNGKLISFNDPDKFKKAVHLADIHLEKGMHCVDCHFGQDSHGDGHIYGEVAQAVEIDCIDCHGTVSQRANLKASGPAAKAGKDFSFLKTQFGEMDIRILKRWV
jgi:hypothetical protein